MRNCTLALVPMLALTGCGGLFAEPCGMGGGVSSNPAYAGTYSGTYTNTSGTAEDLTVQLVLDQYGQMTGAVSESAMQRSAEVAGSVHDVAVSCTETRTSGDIRFTFKGEERRQISGRRKFGMAQPWRFNVTYSLGNNQIGSGTLSLVRE